MATGTPEAKRCMCLPTCLKGFYFKEHHFEDWTDSRVFGTIQTVSFKGEQAASCNHFQRYNLMTVRTGWINNLNYGN